MSHPFQIMKVNGFKISGILQIGASSGQEVEAISNSGSSISILVEPLPEPYSILKEKAMKFKNMTTIQALCSNKSGEEVDFQIADNGGMSSSILKPENHLKIHPEVKFKYSKKIKTITVDDMMSAVKKRLGLPIEKIDTLLMDVQGAEHLVIEGSAWTLRKIKYVYCEVSYGGLYKGDMPLEEFQKMMQDHGFRMHTLIMGRKGWGDALFVRDEYLIQ